MAPQSPVRNLRGRRPHTRSSLKRRVGVAAIAMAMWLLPSAHAAVGFQSITASGLSMGLWYPTQSTETPGRIGPFDVTLAFDAPPHPGRSLQPILMSHGNSGRMRNHNLTAKALAEAGFLVIAPTHSIDHLVGGEDTYKAMNWRTVELAHALEAVLQIAEFRNIVDVSRVHAVGYSLGALTALNAAGAGIDGTLIEAHCSRNVDPAFCDTPSWFLRQKLRYLRGAKPPPLPRDIASLHYPLPFVNGGVAVVAPVGQGATFHGNLFQASKLFIVGFESDDVTVAKYHAQYLAETFPPDRIAHFSLRAGHHAAFIAPFAKRVTDDQFIEAAQDPDGFDRGQFLDKLNRELVAFFTDQSQQKDP